MIVVSVRTESEDLIDLAGWTGIENMTFVAGWKGTYDLPVLPD